MLRRKALNFAIAASGMLMYLYVSALFAVAAYLGGYFHSVNWTVSLREFGVISASFLVFEIIFFSYTKIVFRKKIESISLANLGSMKFAGLSLVILAAIVIDILVLASPGKRLVEINSIFIATSVAAGFAFYHLMKFFIYVFVYRLFYDRIFSDRKGGILAGIIPRDLLLDDGVSMINYCLRFGIDFGVFAVRLSNIHEIEHQYGERAGESVRKQIAFLLMGISRNYEPWGISGNDTFFSFMQCGGEADFSTARARYESAISGNSFAFQNFEIPVGIETSGAVFSESDLSFPRYENSSREFLENIMRGMTSSMKKIR